MIVCFFFLIHSPPKINPTWHTLTLLAALPISSLRRAYVRPHVLPREEGEPRVPAPRRGRVRLPGRAPARAPPDGTDGGVPARARPGATASRRGAGDRKSTRLNSSH